MKLNKLELLELSQSSASCVAVGETNGGRERGEDRCEVDQGAQPVGGEGVDGGVE